MANKKSNKKTNTKDTKQNKKSDKSRQSKVTVKNNKSHKVELWAILIMILCLFDFVCFLGKAGIVGNLIRGFFFGLFGAISSYIVLILAFVLAVTLLRGTTKKVFRFRNVALTILLLLFFGAMLHALAFQKPETGNVFKNLGVLWSAHKENVFSGGIIGGGIADVAMYYLEKVGALFILIPGTVVLAFLLFGISIMPFFNKIGDAAKLTKDKIEVSYKESREKKAEKEAQERASLEERQKNVAIKEQQRLEREEEARKEAEAAKLLEKEKALDNNEADNKTTKTFVYNDKNPEEDPFNFDFDVDTETGEIKEHGTKKKDEDVKQVDGFTPISFDEMEISNDAGTASEDNTVEKPDGLSPDGDTENGENEGPKLQTVYDEDTPLLNSGAYSDFTMPSLDLLNLDLAQKKKSVMSAKIQCEATGNRLLEILRNYGVEATITNCSIGPSVTRFELLPKMGTVISSIKNRQLEIATYLPAESVVIEAPIPGKAAVGIEIPNKERSTVYLKEVLASDAFTKAKSKLTFAVGQDVDGNAVVCDMEKLPHLLIGGTTGSGKSVCTNGIILSLLYKNTPDELKLILIDPKFVEFSKYNGIPHLIMDVVTEPKKAAAALTWAVAEMDKRYKFFQKYGSKDIGSYNAMAERTGLKTMPRIVIVIDELADLMMVAKQSVEIAINRIAQKARACGMHLIIATQRPSVDVVTGLIKANIPSRIGLRVSSGTDSRILIDQVGAENLLGRGDMIFAPTYNPKPTRVQGVFEGDDEIERVVKAVSKNKSKRIPSDSNSAEAFVNAIVEDMGSGKSDKSDKTAGEDGEKKDGDRYAQVLEFAYEQGEISVSLIQRKFHVGYNTAADIFDKMVEDGVVERSVGAKRSKVIKRLDE